MDRELRHLFIPVKKEGESYRAILSDDSCDRDNEFMSPDLIKAWAQRGSLPLLANHENAMQSFIGVWQNPKVVEVDGHTALAMEPNFFSHAANPLAQQIKTQIDEASKMGQDVGVSVGFIPQNGKMVGDRYMHTEAELVEASIVPVQSNRNAYVSMAKRFNLGNDSNKKTTDAFKDGGQMADGETKTPEVKEESTKAPTIDEIKSTHDARIKELEAAKVKEIADLQAKHEAEIKSKMEAEKKIADELTEYKAKVKELENAPKGKVPAAMLGNSGVPKEADKKDEKFNATKAWAKNRGLEAEE